MDLKPTTTPWYQLKDTTTLSTPGLLLSPEHIDHNINAMMQIAGDVKRLWPHIKTHKMPEVIQRQMAAGITRFKCATLDELALLVAAKAPHILLAMQPSEDKVLSILRFQKDCPDLTFHTLVDNLGSLNSFSKLTLQEGQSLNLWLDLNVGMNRTGIVPGATAAELYLTMSKTPGITAQGLHAYDGHIRPLDLNERKAQCDAAFQSVLELRALIESKGAQVQGIIAGGSPTFLPHAQRGEGFLSPGTTLLWDAGYARLWPESPFLHAALLATRVISKPNANLLCFDLGHKAMAPEMPMPRVQLFGLETAKHIKHSEEHLVVETPLADNFNVGDVVYALPFHICPTVVKYNKAYTINKGAITGTWDIKGRNYITY